MAQFAPSKSCLAWQSARDAQSLRGLVPARHAERLLELACALEGCEGDAALEERLGAYRQAWKLFAVGSYVLPVRAAQVAGVDSEDLVQLGEAAWTPERRPPLRWRARNSNASAEPTVRYR